MTIPRHDALRVGTLSAILADVAGYLGVERDDLLRQLFTRELSRPNRGRQHEHHVSSHAHTLVSRKWAWAGARALGGHCRTLAQAGVL